MECKLTVRKELLTELTRQHYFLTLTTEIQTSDIFTLQCIFMHRHSHGRLLTVTGHFKPKTLPPKKHAQHSSYQRFLGHFSHRDTPTYDHSYIYYILLYYCIIVLSVYMSGHELCGSKCPVPVPYAEPPTFICDNYA